VLTRTTVVVGNPKVRSRTSAAAAEVASFVADRLGATPATTTIELPDLGSGLLGWGDPAVGEALAATKDADLLVVASPTYKATYTGLLKLFLDQIGADELAGVVTVPVMVGASPAHALAVETHLRPVLVELGATMPTRGLYLQESALAELELAAVLDAWWTSAEGPLRKLLD
jgi:FMN reductase